MDGMKRIAAAGLGIGVALTASAVVASAAQAQTLAQPYTPEQICGSGFQVIESQPLGKAGEARVYFLNNGPTNCVVTLKQGAYVGNSVKISARLQIVGGSTQTDGPAAFKYYAGPLKADPQGGCMVYGGTYGSYSYTSPSTCG
ncbi:hypothetical protein GCM10023195_15770 [Actinoallomurus liliacearum]|uniref:Spore-associated protein A n=2 Tax=Actinoallomurus liliacearum TaxID=1080073 RepID=A0ABP8TES5_9ACTN